MLLAISIPYFLLGMMLVIFIFAKTPTHDGRVLAGGILAMGAILAGLGTRCVYTTFKLMDKNAGK